MARDIKDILADYRSDAEKTVAAQRQQEEGLRRGNSAVEAVQKEHDQFVSKMTAYVGSVLSPVQRDFSEIEEFEAELVFPPAEERRQVAYIDSRTRATQQITEIATLTFKPPHGAQRAICCAISGISQTGLNVYVLTRKKVASGDDRFAEFKTIVAHTPTDPEIDAALREALDSVR
ncbi:hypothetical protein [Sorangium sp. So ce1182]|uniref:hypothetical protein n=1 Tax=Sorangium sp. So ce1182 TaxID=3133334 RepID=UPI003F64871B